MYGDHGAGKAGTNDSDIEDGRDFSHGLIKDENGEMRFRLTIPF
jgi:hypothetical protein